MPILSNPRHELFAQETAKGVCGAEAYRTAGFSAHGQSQAVNANRLLKTAKVRARVAEILSEREVINQQATAKAIEATALTKEWVIGRLRENVERAMQATEITTASGRTGEYRYDGAVANRALELLGKELGMFIDRKEIGGPGDFERMSDAELSELVRQEAGDLDDATVH